MEVLHHSRSAYGVLCVVRSLRDKKEQRIDPKRPVCPERRTHSFGGNKIQEAGSSWSSRADRSKLTASHPPPVCPRPGFPAVGAAWTRAGTTRVQAMARHRERGTLLLRCCPELQKAIFLGAERRRHGGEREMRVSALSRRPLGAFNADSYLTCRRQ